MYNQEKVIELVYDYLDDEGLGLTLVESEGLLITSIRISRGPKVDLIFRIADDQTEPERAGLTAKVCDILTGLYDDEDREDIAASCSFLNTQVRYLCFCLGKDSLYARYQIPAFDYFSHKELYGKLCFDLIRQFQKELDLAFPVFTKRLYNRRPKWVEEHARKFAQLSVSDEEEMEE